MALGRSKVGKRREYLVIAAVLLGAAAVLFGRVLVRGEMFLFRDAAHFYHPSLQYTQLVWGDALPDGRVPLWNPDEELGRPLAADPTASLFYPGKLLFALPIDFASIYVAYVLAHVILASLSMFSACRLFRCTVSASGFAAVSYALSGPILFQYCNVIFLVGAAWLPIGVALGWHAVSRRDWRCCFGFAFVQAMMVLGGDPQLAYYLSLFLFVATMSRRSDPSDGTKVACDAGYFSSVRARLAIAVAAPLLAGGLAAIQVIPSWQWATQSQRLIDRSAEGWFKKPAAGTHRAKSYEFSVPPWRWAELILPNFGGKLFPVHRRWLSVLPASERTWAPSLYMGLLPIVLAMRRSCRPRDGLDRWLRWLVVFGVGGSLGWYGGGWLFNEVSVAAGGEAKYWGPVGGLYWWLNNGLPVHSQFRYPAKLWTLAVCGLAILAAREITSRPKLFNQQTIQILLRRGPWMFLLMAFGTAIVMWFLGPLNGATKSRLFGPLDGRGALFDVCGSFLQLLVVSATGLATFRLVRGRNPRLSLLLVITTLDLVVAHRHSIVSAERSEWRTEPKLVRAIKAHAKEQGDTPFRVHRVTPRGTYPQTWRTESSHERQRNGLRWDRATCAHRFGLSHGISMLRPTASFSSRGFENYVDPSNGIISSERLSDANVQYIIGRSADCAEYPDFSVIAEEELFGETICVAFKKSELHQAWLQGAEGKRFDEGILCLEHVSHRVRLSANLQEAGTVVLADAFDQGWQCRVENMRTGTETPCEIKKVDGIFRGVDLPSGNYSITFEYRPTGFWVGATVSAICWATLVIGVLVRILGFSLSRKLVT